MKRTILLLSFFFVFLFGCKNGNDKPVNTQKSTHEFQNRDYYDDELDTKSTAIVDTVEFRKQMNQLLPPKRISELFGSGYQVFYLALVIYDTNHRTYCRLLPLRGYENFERGLFKENIELSEDYAILSQKNDESKAINLKHAFYSFNRSLGKSFKTSPGMINGYTVISRKIFQIDVSIDNSGNIINPWTIKEISRELFRPHLKNKLTRDDFNGIFPARLKEDYKSYKDKVVFPKEAIERGVTGKVLVKLFFETDGTYAGYQFIKGLGYGCEEALIKALRDYTPSSYPSGERTSVVLPFSFGASKNTPVDIYVKSFEYSPTAKYNQLTLALMNKRAPVYSSKIKYSIYVFLNNELIFGDYVASLNWNPETGPKYWIGGKKIKPGTYEYKISIDPEGVLNDVDRSNNTVRGKLVIK